MFLLCKLNQCCCGCTLRTGTLILGICDLVFAAIVLITSASIVGAVQTVDVQDDLKDTVTVVTAVYITLAVFSGLLILIDILLLVGVTQNRAGLLLPYMIFAIISAIANVVSSIIYASYYFEDGMVGSGVSGLIYAFFYLALKWYFISVVYSHYTELKSGGSNNNPNVTVYPHGPQGYPAGPQGYPAGPQGYPAGPQGYPAGPQGYPAGQQPTVTMK